MKPTRIIRRKAAVVIALFLLPAIAAAQQAIQQLSDETVRLKTVVATLNLPKNEATTYLEQMTKVQEAFQHGRSYLGLFLLQRIEEAVLTDQYRLSKSGIEKLGIEAFEQEWKELGKEILTDNAQRTVSISPLMPAAIKAIAERSQTQIRPYYQSGRLYGQNTTIGNGLYYLGLAKAHHDFALFCRSLRFNNSKTPLPVRSLEPELGKLEAETLQAYQQADVAKQQASFNQINSALKMAMELNNEKRFSGALLQYLEVSRIFWTATSSSAELPPLDQLKHQVETMHARLSSRKTDQSIGLLYLEAAQSRIETAEGQSDEAMQRSAAIILNRILPRYLNITEKQR